MLISQRVAKDVNFLKSTRGMIDRSIMHQLRTEIIHSVKFLISTEFFEEKTTLAKLFQKVYGVDYFDKELAKKKELIFDKFSRPPFPSIFLENNYGGFLITETIDGQWSMVRVSHTGAVKPLIGDVKHISDNYRKISYVCFYDLSEIYSESDIEDLKVMTDVDIIIASELMMYMNVANVHVHEYKPSRKENAMIPKTLQPYYTYRIVDIFRERSKYISLQDAISFTQKSKEEHLQRRAHIVKGHFKEIRNKLYWWSAFVRCKKNIDNLGVVDKDYRLH